MGKIGVNEQCPCGSGKKYKRCCINQQIEERNNRILEKENLDREYINGKEEHSAKIKFCMNYYQELFPEHKIINMTNVLTTDNYKEIQLKNFNKNTIMLTERTDTNGELFDEKSNNDQNDLIVMYKGSYRTFEAISIMKYLNDVKKMIETRDKGYSDN